MRRVLTGAALTFKNERSRALFKRAGKVLVGGVNSPVRAYRAVGGNPLFISAAKGSRIVDADGNEYIDYVCSWGALILGSAHPRIIQTLQQASSKGTSYGAPTENEVVLAELIREALPSIELVRFVNSGTEATMSALRLARAYTKRNKIVKLDGCYHGHSDGLLVKGGSGLATFGIADSAGIPENFARQTLVAPFNNLHSVKMLFEDHGQEIAALIVEPVAGNMGVIPPREGYLRGLKEITRKYGALLIFDEVITGFRVAYGGAQTIYNVEPDISCLGKVIGGGLPVAAYGGREDLMQLVAPLGPVYQAGTLSGNPLAMAAGVETLRELRRADPYALLEKVSSRLQSGFMRASAAHDVATRINRVGSMLGLFFTDADVIDFQSAKTTDAKRYANFFWRMLERGVYLPPSAFETIFVSATHTSSDIEKTVEAANQAFASLAA